MGEPFVPFNRAYESGRERDYVSESISSGALSGDGPFTKRVTDLIVARSGAEGGLLTTSCTHALEMSAVLLDLEPGDEVIMPSFTFVSTANAYALRGAVPVFVDCRPDTLNIDERLIEAAITERTKAIVVVHYAGVACEMDEIMAIAGKHQLPVIEDNAHGLGGSYRGRPLGSIGAMATQSFHVTKNIQCGEGGAFLATETALLERAEIIREKGTNRAQFFRGMVDKYRWMDYGSSYLPSDMLAAFLTAQMESFDEIHQQRQHVWSSYHTQLADWAGERGIAQPMVPDHVEHPAHLYYLLLHSADEQRAFITHLKERGVGSVFHYVPLHSAPAGEKLGRSASPDGCPITDDVWCRLVRLPLFAGMREDELSRVIDAVRSFKS
ncbi:MAG: dTDP-4-amino-4,6-dideoxygalactose transaminase [Corynebacteriales bacterium]|nr:dTDP-4-amino-4,6-dideoxygalactose transaminase [Mycobacteriales bacterium]